MNRNRIHTLIENTIREVTKQPISIVRKTKIGECSGVVFFEKKDVINWTNKEMIDGQLREQLRKIDESEMMPMAILENIKVNLEARGKGNGKATLEQFIEAASMAKTVLLTADVGQVQIEGFNLLDWYQRQGFKPVGKSGSNVVMVKENFSHPNKQRYSNWQNGEDLYEESHMDFDGAQIASDLANHKNVLMLSTSGIDSWEVIEQIYDYEEDGRGSASTYFDFTFLYKDKYVIVVKENEVTLFAQLEGGSKGSYWEPAEEPEAAYSDIALDELGEGFIYDKNDWRKNRENAKQIDSVTLQPTNSEKHRIDLWMYKLVDEHESTAMASYNSKAFSMKTQETNQ